MSGRRDVLAGASAAIALVALNVLVVSSALGFVHKPRRVLETDHYRYIEMAQAPPGKAEDPRAREQPFCWRILVPALVRALSGAGLSLDAAFWATTTLFLALFLFTLFWSLRTRGHGLGASLAGMALAALMPGAVRWYAYQYWMPDPLCLFLVALGFHLAVIGGTRALALVSVAGLLTRETYLVVPVFALLSWLRREGPMAAARHAGVSFAAPLAAFVALRLVIVPEGGPSLLVAAREMLGFRARHLLDNQLYFATLGTFGVLVPLLLARAWRLPAFLREHYDEAAIVIVAYASLAFANNTDRLLVYGLPVLIPAGLRALDALAQALSWPPGVVLALALGIQAFVYERTPFHGTMGLSLYQPVLWSVVAVLTAFGVGAVLALRRGAQSS